MQYEFVHSDGRRYGDNRITVGFKVNSQKIGQTIRLKVFAAEEERIAMTLNQNEAVAIACSLLASTHSTLKICAEQ